MTITINGKEQDMNVGCRTFISLKQFIALLKIEQSGQFSIGLNGERVDSQKFASTMIKSGDNISF